MSAIGMYLVSPLPRNVLLKRNSPVIVLPNLLISYPTRGTSVHMNVKSVKDIWCSYTDGRFGWNINDKLSTKDIGLTTSPLMPQNIKHTVGNVELANELYRRTYRQEYRRWLLKNRPNIAENEETDWFILHSFWM